MQALATELSSGKVDLPSFPDIAMRVRQVLADDNVTPDKIVRVVGSRARPRRPPAAARELRRAQFQRQGGHGPAHGREPHGLQHGAQRRDRVCDVAAQEGGCAQRPREAARRCCGSAAPRVAAMIHVVARRLAQGEPRHRDARRPAARRRRSSTFSRARASIRSCSRTKPVYHTIVRDWHSSIAKALLENWDMAEEIVRPSANSKTLSARIPAHRPHGRTDRRLTCSHPIATTRTPSSSTCRASPPARACSSTARPTTSCIHESGDEIAAIQHAARPLTRVHGRRP